MLEILMVTTSFGASATNKRQYGLWLDDFLVSYYFFKDMGFKVSVASPKGGPVPILLASRKMSGAIQEKVRFLDDQNAQNLLRDTLRLAQIYVSDFCGLYFVGGTGALHDFRDDRHLSSLIREAVLQNKPMAFLGHSVVALLDLKISERQWLVSMQRVALITNEDSLAIQKFDMSDCSFNPTFELQGAFVEQAALGTANVVHAEHFITGQNSESVWLLNEAFYNKILLEKRNKKETDG